MPKSLESFDFAAQPSINKVLFPRTDAVRIPRPQRIGDSDRESRKREKPISRPPSLTEACRRGKKVRFWRRVHATVQLLVDEDVTLPKANLLPASARFGGRGRFARWVFPVPGFPIRITDSLRSRYSHRISFEEQHFVDRRLGGEVETLQRLGHREAGGLQIDVPRPRRSRSRKFGFAQLQEITQVIDVVRGTAFEPPSRIRSGSWGVGGPSGGVSKERCWWFSVFFMTPLPSQRTW